MSLQAITCPTCNGKKQSYCHLNYGSRGGEWKRVPCDQCEGTGSISAEKLRILEAGKRLRDRRKAAVRMVRDEAARLGITARELSDAEWGRLPLERLEEIEAMSDEEMTVGDATRILRQEASVESLRISDGQAVSAREGLRVAAIRVVLAALAEAQQERDRLIERWPETSYAIGSIYQANDNYENQWFVRHDPVGYPTRTDAVRAAAGLDAKGGSDAD